METKGYVTYAGNNLFGGKRLFSFRVGTEDKFFGTGTQEHNLQKNDYIEFKYNSVNGKYNVDVSDIKHVAREESSSASSGAIDTRSVRPSAAKPSGSSEYWDERFRRDVANDSYRKVNDQTIQYQSARNAAINVVDYLVRERLLKLSDAAKADNVAVVLGKIDDLTNEFFAKSTAVGKGSTSSGDEPDTGGGGDSSGDTATGSWK